MSVLVVLVGAPGSGKTTVGAALSEALGRRFRDTDADVAHVAGMPVPDIFITEGEAGFRSRESAAVQSALAEHDGVLAIGGGAIETAAVRDALRSVPVVWLQVDAATAVERVGLSGPRPVLLGNVRGQWSALMDRRSAAYAAVATWQIDTTDRTPSEVAAAIVAAMGEHHD
jgi:shikimate kinase